MGRRFGLTLVVLAAFLAVSLTGARAQAPAQGQPATPPPPPQNLQVLPKDIARADLIAMMRGFTAGLGVECNYCHVMEGRGGRNDMAADEKPTKITARVMMRMVAGVNQQLASAITKADLQKVECGTCHRGAAIPIKFQPPPAPPQAAPMQGPPPPPGR